MSSTIITNHPAPGASVTVLYPGEAGTDSARVTVISTLGGAQLNGREARMVASRLIRAAGRISMSAAKMTTTTEPTTATTDRLMAIIAGHQVSDSRQASLARAIELGASDALLAQLRGARKIHRNSTTIVLPRGRYMGLSRSRGWARCGRGDGATWGEEVQGGYRVGAGNWIVWSTDGFRRKDRTKWTVRHVQVGTETWTVAV